jgi:hypothetical protein
MIQLFLALFFGGTTTFLAVWQYGLGIALLCAPFGASLFTLMVSVIRAYCRARSLRRRL